MQDRKTIVILKAKIRVLYPTWNGLLPKDLTRYRYARGLQLYLERLQAKAMLDLTLLELGQEENQYIELMGAMPKPPNYGIPAHLVIDETIRIKKDVT